MANNYVQLSDIPSNLSDLINDTNYISSGSNISELINDIGYLTSYTETDPIFTASDAASITSVDIGNWNTAYGWGDHSVEGYATETYVNTTVSNLVDSAPSTLDTLNELAAVPWR